MCVYYCHSYIVWIFHYNKDFCSVSVNTEKKLTTRNQVCNDDPDYDYYQCVESYFYSKRGCQYPWNSYANLNLPRCKSYTNIQRMIKTMDPNDGYNRHLFPPSERFIRTEEQCPPPCFAASYSAVFETWPMHGSNVSLQIAFADFKITQREEYLACDDTCIIGQIGGNLGLFLGGSILLGIDMLMDYIFWFAVLIKRKFQ